MRTTCDTTDDLDPLAPVQSFELFAPWAGVLRGALIGACAWTALLAVWILY
jgi:hypothetical protein